ncbi:MAG: bifunctional aspartate kinase/homoserine dehydrogenase I [Bacteroidota bacterium]
MKILKFGGSSVANHERISNVANIIQSYVKAGEKVAVAVSALGGATDMLIRMGKTAAEGDSSYKLSQEAFSTRHREVVNQLIDYDKHPAILNEIVEGQIELSNLLQGVYLTRELTARTLDYILSFGERSSAFILAEVLKQIGTEASYIDARKVIKTNDSYGRAKVFKEETYANIQKMWKGVSGVPIVTGFLASSPQGFPTTLGRGGSDYTASILGAALEAEEIIIYTDVNGVLTADPRKVKKAFPVSTMTYAEAMEMSHFGARVIYPPTIVPALEKNIPIRIKNSFEPEAEGTLISNAIASEEYTVKGISSIPNVSLVTFEGSGIFGASSAAARLFTVLASEGINAILITQGSSEHSICFAVEPIEAQRTQSVIEEEFKLEINAGLIAPVKVIDDLSVVAIIGDNMKSRPGISARLFEALGKNGVNVILTAQGASERNISVIIKSEDEAKALSAIHDNFFLSEAYTLNLFVIGVGLIGSTLLKQFENQADFLRESQYVEFNVVALANSRKMKFDENGIALSSWRDQLDASEEKMDIEAFVKQMINMNLPNSVFIDNTANSEIIKYYDEILDASISISTPNKVATSSKYEDYKALKGIADKRGVKFLYETNVGAGLPVITTINDLVNSGDKILKIEGVLSGSLSYIFNSFDGSVPFSEVVAEAKAKGYTEPDPREDLSGSDVARKLTILARESGRPLEGSDISIESILPESVWKPKLVEGFFEELRKVDEQLDQMREDAANDGQKLRFIATLEGGEAYIKLQKVGVTNPFFNLSGSENMIVFTTERYKECPLVIKGPGAGAEVTAAGVFAEILRIGYFLS